MLADEYGKPLPGDEALQLGVRLQLVEDDGNDIPKDESGNVHPDTGGMSVTADDPKKLPGHRRPLWLGGRSKRGQLFVIERRYVPNSLSLRKDDEYHHLVEPMREMAFEEYVDELVSTRPHWNLVPEPAK
ncbi:MAG: hypothetical protein WA777_11230 [Rhodanobacter sp.]